VSNRHQGPRRRRRAATQESPERLRTGEHAPVPDAAATVAVPARLRKISHRPDAAQIIAGIPDAVTSFDLDWRYVYVNQKAIQNIGRPADELLGRSVWEVFPGGEDTLTHREFHRAMAEQRPTIFEDYSVPLGVWFEHRLFPSPKGLTVWSRDVSERREAESERTRLLRALTESEERFRALIENSRDGVVMTDPSGAVLYASPSATQIGGWRRDEMRGRSFVGSVHRDDRARLLDDRRRLLGTPGAVIAGEYRFPHRDGSWLWIEMVEQNLLHHPGVGAIVTNFRDVTDRKNAERNLETLLEVARDIGETLELEPLLEQVQRKTAAALACDVVVTFRWDEDAGLFRVAGQLGCAAERTAELEALVFRPFEPFGGRLAEGAVAIGHDDERPEAIARLCEHFGWSALIVAPLRLRGRQLGAIAATFATPERRVAAWETALLAGIARQLAVALERVETHRLEHEVSAVSAALASLGGQLLASFDHPRLLDRLCELTATAIGCASCVTFLWRPEAEAFVPVASHGLSAARAEEIRLLGAQRAAIPDLLLRLAREDVFVQVDLPTAELRAIPSRLRPRPGTTLLFSALRRGEHVVGFQVSAHDPIDRPFSTLQLRVARGAAQLVSMALEHGRILEQLAQANRLKSDFVAMMSHELRTPLHVVLGYGDLLLDGAFGKLDPKVLDVLSRMRRSSQELLQLVDEVLDLNRLESGRIPVHLHEVSPAELLAEVEARCADVERSPAVELKTSCAPDLPPIVTDAAKVSAILKNLIGNALKFTSTGEVVVSIAAQDDGLALTVSDTGMGITPEQQPLIFDPFRQGDSTMTRRFGGVGLGLYIVRRMVECLGGRIALDSEPGRGSTFRVWIPDGRRPILEDRGRLETVLATTGGEAAIVDPEGTIVAVNERWLAFASTLGARATERLGVGVNYFEVCARACDRDVTVAQSASAGLRAVLDGLREHFTLDWTCDTAGGPRRYRMQVSALGGATRYALVSHTPIEIRPRGAAP